MKRAAFALLLALVLGGRRAFPQMQSPEKQAEIPMREESAQEAARKAALEAQRRRLAEGEGEVTWQQVLERPDDVELNFRFARAQIRQGNLRGATATLERLLMINPSLHKARLVYAIVLFRLDNIGESERELKALSKEALPEDIRAEVRGYLDEIAKKRRRTHVNAALSMGFGYDDNRNFAPSSGQRLFADTPIPLAENSLRQNDTDILGIGNLRITRDLPSENGHQVFANLTYLRDEQTVVKRLDLQAYSAQLGAVYKTAFANFTPTAAFDHVLLAQETFLRNRGGGMRADKTLTSRLVGRVEAAYTYQNFVNTQGVPTADQRSGDQWEGYAGADYVLAPAMRAGATIGYLHKNAVRRFYSYNRISCLGVHTWLLGKGMFLSSQLTLNLDYYQQPDFAISALKRRDQTIIPRFTFGAPLGLIAKPLSATLFTLTYQYYHALSSITNYAYTDNKVAGAFIYQFSY